MPDAELAPAPLPQPWIQTPAFLHDRARRIHAAMMGLNDVITALTAAHRLTTDNPRYKQWKTFINNFGSWYQETGPTTWMWTGTDATLQAYELNLQSWEAWLRRTFPDTAASLPPVPPTYGSDGKERPDGVPTWVKVAGAVAAGIVIANLVTAVSRR